MPVSYNSAARNLFLLGSSGQQVAQNFFKYIDKDNGTGDGYIDVEQIRYIESDEKYVIAGSGRNLNLVSYGFFEKRDYNQETTTTTLDYETRIVSTGNNATINFASLENLHVDSNGDLIACGVVDGTTPWIGKYSYSTGVVQWQSTTNQGGINYRSVTSDSSGYYACGHSPITGEAVVEKYDLNGNPLWGKKVSTVGGSSNKIQLFGIACNSRGQLVAVGDIVDLDQTKGYMIKFTTSGEFLWDKSLQADIETSSFDHQTRLDGIHIDDKDQIYVVGHIQSTFGFFRGSDRTGWIGKYSAEGNLIWQRESNNGAGTHMSHRRVFADNQTEQVIVLGYWSSTTDDGAALSKYSKNGNLLWRRSLISDSSSFVDNPVLDADSSFYYLAFVDEDRISITNTPEGYVFGKVSTSGNGLGAFQYPDGGGINQGYEILNITDKIGRLDDGSVRFDSSDLRKTPFSANHIVFDDYATPVTKKKVNIKDAGVIQYSGSPAIRPADFQELNLLGDVYSGSGDWLDQSGNDNDGVTSFTTTTTLPGTTESENFVSTTSSYSTYGTVAENTVTNDLPFTAAHYSGKVRDLQTGGFRIDLTGNSNANAFFMGCWIKFDTYATSRQMGIDLSGSYVYWETLANGAIAVRHNGGSRADSGATSLNDGNWHHIALSRTGSTLYGFLDGTAVISTTNGVGGASVSGGNENFWFFGGSGTSYNVDAKVLDPFVYLGSGVSSYTVPTAPLIDSDGNINHFSGFGGQEGYISPAISLPGGTTTTTNGPTHNAAGYWEFDGTDDTIDLGTKSLIAPSSSFSIEAWCWVDSLTPECTIYEISANGNPGTIMLSAGSTTDGNVGGRFLVRNSSGQDQGVRDVINNNLGEWHHYVGVHINNGNFSSTCLYVDGVGTMCQDKIDAPHAFDFTDVGVQHLGLSAGSRYLDGRIGEVRIYPRDLTAAQIFQNYNSTKSKYINEAPDTAPKIGPSIVYDSNLLLNYDFGNRATYDPAENIVPNSQNKTGWNQVRGTIADVDIVAPDGTSGAFLYTESTETGPHHFKIPYNTGGSDYGDEITWSSQLYFKRYGSKNRIRFGLNTKDDTYRHLLFDFTTGQVENEYSISGTYSVDNVGGGWYRLNLTDNGDTGSTRPHAVMSCFMIQNDTTSTSSYTGDGESGVYFWGPNLKIGSTSRYIRTYGSAITAPTTVKNLSSNSFPGTINGATFNPAGYFDFDGPPGLGAGDYINIGTTSTFNWIHDRTESGWAIEGWYLNDRDEEYGALISNNSGTSAVGFYMGQRNDSLFECTINKGTAGTPACSVLSTNVLDHNTWYHIMFVNDNYTIKLYVNGVLQSNAGDQNSFSTGSTANAQTDLRIAKLADSPTWNLDGEIGEVRIYQTSLSATEVSQNFNATRGKYGV